MKTRFLNVLPRCLVLCGMLAIIWSDTLPAIAQTPEMVKKASIIFVGTVVKLKAVSFPGVPVSGKTAVVRVERVIEKPATVTLPEGQEITVGLKDPSKMKVGNKATFYAEGWILGQGVAVREVGHELMTLTATRAPGEAEAKVAQVRQQLSDTDLKARIKGADMVVVGRVSSIRKAAVAAGGKPRITEHDPDWQEATIKVESSMKGSKGGDEVVLRFPGSNDVMFRNHPKFKADQEGVFIMKKDAVTGLPRLMVGNVQKDAYVAHKYSVLLPKSDSAKVQRLLKQQ